MSGKHVEKLARKGREVDTKEFAIQFSPAALKEFKKIESAVRDSPHFDQDFFLNLQEITSGKPRSIENTLMDVAYLARNIVEYEKETGDSGPSIAMSRLNEFIYPGSTKGLTLVAAPKRDRTV